MTEHVWTRRLSRIGFYAGIAALVIGVGGAFIAGLDLIPKLAGLSALLVATIVAIAGALVALVAIVLNLRHKAGWMMTAFAGLVISGGYAGFMASRAVVAQNYPAIHDITTDLVNPPDFVKLKLRADNLAGVDSLDKWRELHRQAYGHIKPIVINKPVSVVIANAEKLANDRGWEIALSDAVEGRLEATASVSLIKFKDDVVIRAMPTPSGQGTLVDMRSVSRIGQSDLGVNAKRVAEFLAALSKA